MRKERTKNQHRIRSGAVRLITYSHQFLLKYIIMCTTSRWVHFGSCCGPRCLATILWRCQVLLICYYFFCSILVHTYSACEFFFFFNLIYWRIASSKHIDIYFIVHVPFHQPHLFKRFCTEPSWFSVRYTPTICVVARWASTGARKSKIKIK